MAYERRIIFGSPFGVGFPAPDPTASAGLQWPKNNCMEGINKWVYYNMITL